ncbi:hypothetical protein CLPUN_50300 [Clostridium puniceum]|uniref:Uncharacterized protein n=1 Tax=Clostridium puniceum TaxID=29367 RepID=A0A1S8SZY3_9CLOT|nr:hypothetical protein CLPUN_50300 [Clostridium puniceum]
MYIILLSFLRVSGTIENAFEISYVPKPPIVSVTQVGSSPNNSLYSDALKCLISLNFIYCSLRQGP